jgi:hypothetical protein
MKLILAAPSPTTEILSHATRCGARMWVNEFQHSGSIPHQRIDVVINGALFMQAEAHGP